MKLSSLPFGLIAIVHIWCATGKVYTPMELASELRDIYKVPEDEVNIWVCIAMRESGLNTSVVSKPNKNGNSGHGLFQINDLFSCSTTEVGKGCSAQCSSFEDSDIKDDVLCARRIHAEHKSISGQGFNAWDSYKNFCITNVTVPTKVLPDNRKGKIYERCELARELRDVHNIPTEQVGIWVCIMERSGYDTSIQIPLNSDGNFNHGILQINDVWWCGQKGPGGNCNVDCKEFEDGNIGNDVECAQMIISETRAISGDGFTAWPIYAAKCKEKAAEYINGCGFDLSVVQSTARPSPTTTRPLPTTTRRPRTTTIAAKTQILKSGGIVFEPCDMARELLKNDISLIDLDTWMCIIERESNFNTSSDPLLQSDGSRAYGLFKVSNTYWCSHRNTGCNLDCAKLMDADISDDVKCGKTIFDVHGFSAWNSYNRWCKSSKKIYSKSCGLVPIETARQSNSDVLGKGKVYELCELAQELLYVHKIPKKDINTWVCIMEGESNFITSRVSELHADGSRKYGILQINDKKWCTPANADMGCGVSCDKLKDSNIADDIDCGLKIQKNAGFSEWGSYEARCRFRTETYTRDCFRPQEEVTDPPEATTEKTVKPTGKIYDKCELARELRYVHRFPADQINTWVCIVENESVFNTSAVGALNEDGSKDHGLFQISDKYWCGDEKLCGISCADLKDSDIFDDVSCVRNIFAAEQRFSKNGFKAWSTYDIFNCGRKTPEYTKHCFDGLDERGLSH